METGASIWIHQRIRSFRVNHHGKISLRALARKDGSVRIAGGAEESSRVKAFPASTVAKPELQQKSYFTGSQNIYLSGTLIPYVTSPTIGIYTDHRRIPLSWYGRIPVKTIEVIEMGAKWTLLEQIPADVESIRPSRRSS